MAVDKTSPGGRVIGIDVIPAQPPRGVSTIQGNFLSKSVQEEVKRFIREGNHCRHPLNIAHTDRNTTQIPPPSVSESGLHYLDGRSEQVSAVASHHEGFSHCQELSGINHQETKVDVVLSDMSAPWEQTSGFWKRSLSDPYFRMMNTSGMSFRDHAGSMVSRLAPYWNENGSNLSMTGPMQSSTAIQQRSAQCRWTLRLQILSGCRG